MNTIDYEEVFTVPTYSKIVTTKPPKRTRGDREWALRKTIDEAHAVVSQKKKRNYLQ